MATIGLGTTSTVNVLVYVPQIFVPVKVYIVVDKGDNLIELLIGKLFKE